MPSPAAPDYTQGLDSDARVLVTGGSGFIGTNLVGAYRAAGVNVRNADIAAPRNPADRNLWVAADVDQMDSLRAIVESFTPTHVFHLGARTDLDGDRLTDYSANVSGVTNVLEVLHGASTRPARVVVASSRMVCEIGYQPKSDEDYCPPNAYGASKVETERIVRATADIPWVLVRPTSIWGPWFDVPYRDFFLAVARGRYVHPAGRSISKNFGYVGNTIWQLHRLMTAPEPDVRARTFYVGDPAIEVRDFADRISRALGRRATREVPLGVLRALALTGDVIERVGRRAPLTSFRLNNLLTPMHHDLAALASVAGEPPFGLDESVPTTVAWLREQRLVV